MLNKLRQFLGLENLQEKLERYESISKSFEQVDEQLNQLAKTFYIEKCYFHDRMNDPDNFTIQNKIKDKFDKFLTSHKEDIRKSKKEYDKLKKEKENIEKDERIEKALKEIRKSEAYGRIKKSYQEGKISLESFNAVIKGLTKEDKTKYADFILFNEKGQILILKRSQWEDNHKGAWVIPGGHVDPGEDFETAAIRELREESGFNVDRCTNVGSYQDENAHIEYFQATINTSEQSPILDVFEARDLQWIDIDEVHDYEFIFNMKENLIRILGIEENGYKKILKGSILGEYGDNIIKYLGEVLREDRYKEKLEQLEARRTDKQYSKEEVNYVDNFKEGNHIEENSCDRCEYYRPKQKDNCLKVFGKVSHNGHCKLWEHTDIDKSLDFDLQKSMLSDLYINLHQQIEKQSNKANFLVEKGFNDEANLLLDEIEKAKKDISKLNKIKKLVYKHGKVFMQTYYVKTGETVEEEVSEKIGAITEDLNLGDNIEIVTPKGTFSGEIIDVDKGHGASNNYYICLLQDNGEITWKSINLIQEYTLNKETKPEYTVIKQLGGSTGAQLVEDKYGNKYVKKTGKDKEHIDIEYQALLLYSMLGVNVPHIHEYDEEKGELYTEYLYGHEKINPDIKSTTDSISKDFVVDALLGNWDVVGMGYDNILVGSYYSSSVRRVDVGGSLTKRAQGENKEFGPEVTELETLRDPNINPQSAKVFANLTDEDINQQLIKVTDKYDAWEYDINKHPNISQEIKDKLKARVEYLRSKIKKEKSLEDHDYNFNGDLYSIDEFEEIPDNVRDFYKHLNEDLKITQEDLDNLPKHSWSLQQVQQRMKNKDVYGTPLYNKCKEIGMNDFEIYSIFDYTEGSSEYNYVAQKYIDSLTGNVNFSLNSISKEEKKLETKEVVTDSINLSEHLENIKAAILSMNHYIETNGKISAMNSTKLENALVSYQKLENFRKKSLDDENIHSDDYNAISSLRNLAYDFKDHYETHINSENPPKFPETKFDIFKTPTVEFKETKEVEVSNTAENSFQIKGFKNQDVERVAKFKLLCNSLTKLGTIRDKQFYKRHVFHRGIDAQSKDLDQFKKEHSKTNDFLLTQWGSSTTYKGTGFTNNTLLKVAGDGVWIDQLSAYKGSSESEVLIRPFTMYQITDYVENHPMYENRRVVSLRKIN